jgi:hypothetical protein
MPGPVVAQQPTQVSDQETLARTAVAAALPEPSTPMHFRVDLPHGSLRGCVVTAELREPVAGATVKLRSLNDCLPAGLTVIDSRDVARTANSGADGAFAFAELPGGAYELLASTANGRSAKIRMAIGEGEQQVTLALAHPDPLRGLVVVKVVDPNRLPVEGADVTIAAVDADGDAIGWNGKPPIMGRTGRDGVFRFEDPSLEQIGAGLVLARCGDRVGICKKVDDWVRASVEVVVDQPGILVGSLVGLPGHDWSEGTVTLHALFGAGVAQGLDWATVRTHPDREGSFRVEGLPAASYQLELDADGVARVLPAKRGGNAAMSRYPWEAAAIRIAAGATTATTVAVGAAAKLRGLVFDAGAAPVAGAEVTVRWRADFGSVALYSHWRAPALRSQASSPFTCMTARTDAHGRYEFSQLQPGVHDVMVTRSGLGMDARPCIALAAGGTVELQHRLVVGGMIHGIAGRDRVCVRDASGSGCLQSLESRHGFRLAGLAPGSYVVGYRTGAGIDDFEPVRTVGVAAGEAVWVDLRQANSCIVDGTLFAEGEPLAGIEVGFDDAGPADAFTGADGSFSVAVGDMVVANTVVLHFSHRAVGIGETRLSGPFAATRHLGSIVLQARRVEVRVLDEEGQPVEAAIEMSGRQLRVPGGLLREQWVRMGELEVCSQIHGGETPGIAVSRSQLTVQIPATGAVPAIVIRRQPTGAARVRVVDADGAAVVGAGVKIVEWDRQGPPPEETAGFYARSGRGRTAFGWTDRDGLAIVRDLHAVPVLVYLWELQGRRYDYKSYDSWTIVPPPADQIVTVRAGETAEVTLRLPR